MTSQEELTYLFGILSEASKWSASPGDDRDFVRMEVEERIRNLINVVAQKHDKLPAEPEKLNEHLPDPKKAAKSVSEWKSKRVRCYENGRHVWHPLCQCHKEKLFPDNPKSKKFRWVWDGPQDKKAQEEDAMWAEHEAAGNSSC